MLPVFQKYGQELLGPGGKVRGYANLPSEGAGKDLALDRLGQRLLGGR